MICPSCDSGSFKCTDSRHKGAVIRRRRRCSECGYIWGTTERIDDVPQEVLRMGTGLINDVMKLNSRWRSVAREVIRGLLARQALDNIKGKDAA